MFAQPNQGFNQSQPGWNQPAQNPYVPNEQLFVDTSRPENIPIPQVQINPLLQDYLPQFNAILITVVQNGAKKNPARAMLFNLLAQNRYNNQDYQDYLALQSEYLLMVACKQQGMPLDQVMSWGYGSTDYLVQLWVGQLTCRDQNLRNQMNYQEQQQVEAAANTLEQVAGEVAQFMQHYQQLIQQNQQQGWQSPQQNQWQVPQVNQNQNTIPWLGQQSNGFPQQQQQRGGWGMGQQPNNTGWGAATGGVNQPAMGGGFQNQQSQPFGQNPYAQNQGNNMGWGGQPNKTMDTGSGTGPWARRQHKPQPPTRQPGQEAQPTPHDPYAEFRKQPPQQQSTRQDGVLETWGSVDNKDYRTPEMKAFDDTQPGPRSSWQGVSWGMPDELATDENPGESQVMRHFGDYKAPAAREIPQAPPGFSRQSTIPEPSAWDKLPDGMLKDDNIEITDLEYPARDFIVSTTNFGKVHMQPIGLTEWKKDWTREQPFPTGYNCFEEFLYLGRCDIDDKVREFFFPRAEIRKYINMKENEMDYDRPDPIRGTHLIGKARGEKVKPNWEIFELVSSVDATETSTEVEEEDGEENVVIKEDRPVVISDTAPAHSLSEARFIYQQQLDDQLRDAVAQRGAVFTYMHTTPFVLDQDDEDTLGLIEGLKACTNPVSAAGMLRNNIGVVNPEVLNEINRRLTQRVNDLIKIVLQVSCFAKSPAPITDFCHDWEDLLSYIGATEKDLDEGELVVRELTRMVSEDLKSGRLIDCLSTEELSSYLDSYGDSEDQDRNIMVLSNTRMLAEVPWGLTDLGLRLNDNGTYVLKERNPQLHSGLSNLVKRSDNHAYPVEQILIRDHNGLWFEVRRAPSWGEAQSNTLIVNPYTH